jgi:hypothetical protein
MRSAVPSNQVTAIESQHPNPNQDVSGRTLREEQLRPRSLRQMRTLMLT